MAVAVALEIRHLAANPEATERLLDQDLRRVVELGDAYGRLTRGPWWARGNSKERHSRVATDGLAPR